jgi:hypothetical protein
VKKQCAQLLTIQVGDFSKLLTDGAVHVLELLEEPEALASNGVASICMIMSARNKVHNS